LHHFYFKGTGVMPLDNEVEDHILGCAEPWGWTSRFKNLVQNRFRVGSQEAGSLRPGRELKSSCHQRKGLKLEERPGQEGDRQETASRWQRKQQGTLTLQDGEQGLLAATPNGAVFPSAESSLYLFPGSAQHRLFGQPADCSPNTVGLS
jgi:hypothetical protein